jgi:hypothetical protein
VIIMVEYYFNREKDYEDWCSEHIEGYVFNHAGGSTGNVLHKVGCQHLTIPSRIGTYTTLYPKYCSDDVMVLSSKADEISKPYYWRRCKDCH